MIESLQEINEPKFQDRLNTHDLCYLYNQTDPLELEQRQVFLKIFSNLKLRI
ncbi:maltose acetyltransferase domain-containing protein [Candidatus Stoquefichus massiliensis]|uniref:maltose acetyltransferase domain-containing protein n=1 Tax=Candidatus Stoquefichus massiliensis TaxID=1470350 RepID=UPI003B967FB3